MHEHDFKIISSQTRHRNCIRFYFLCSLKWRSIRAIRSIGRGFDCHREKLRNNPVQVVDTYVDTYVALSASSIPRYWSKDSDLLWLEK